MNDRYLPIRTLLVVEDDEDLRQVLVDEVLAMGYQVKAAADGALAWEALQTTEVHAILCDIMMPNMNGLAFLGKLRQSGSEVPFVFLTGYQHADHLIKAVKLGCHDFLEKPFNIEDVRAAIERSLELGAKQNALKSLIQRLRQQNPQLEGPFNELERLQKQINGLKAAGSKR